MKLIFVHHALRDRGNPPSQDDDIKELGERDAKIVAEMLLDAQNKGQNIVAIYSSPFYRCMKTAKIVNEHIKLPIFEEKRFNEARSVPGETWIDMQQRMRDALYDIVSKHKEEESVVCVTSGANIVAFISLAYKLPPDESVPFIGVPSCSPLVFDIKKENFV